MQLHEIEHPGAAVFQVKGRLDAATVAELERKVLQSLDRGVRHLVMDFSELEYINSAGLRVLVMSYQRLNPSGGQVVICGVRDYIAEIFDISGYDRIFAMCPDMEMALREVDHL
jgi:anti-sigma B factor antagonist